MAAIKLNEKPKRRDKTVIIAEIMDITKTGALKTQIMYKANLSSSQLNRYLKFLTANDLLVKTASNGKEVFRATSKGKDFLATYEKIMDLLCGEPDDVMRGPPKKKPS